MSKKYYMNVRFRYIDTITRLNDKNLEQALEVVSMLSCLDNEFVRKENSASFIGLNIETVRLLSEAIVKSKSAWYKSSKITYKDFHILFNGAIAALSDKRLEKEVISGGERQEMLYNFQRYLSRVAYIQIRPQHNPSIPLGQLYTLIDVLPRLYWNEFPDELKNDIKYFPNRVTNSLGATVEGLFSAHIAIIDYFSKMGELVVNEIPKPIYCLPSNKLWESKALAIIFDKFSSSLERFRIDLNNFGRIYGTIITGFVKSYGKVFGKDIKTHRSLLTHPDYMIGPDGLRLSSLHRYPLIEAEDGSSWYVPNIRGLIRSFPDALHFTIAELNQESYGIVKGYLLEMYLKMLLKNRTPNLIVIPEEKWPNKGGERRGPDFVVIDHVNPCVLGIEVKSRRMKLNTRFLLSDNDLISNYSDLWKAIKELPEKLSKVFELVGGYQKYKQELDKARNYPRFYLGLSGETPFMFGKLALYQSKRNAEFPLYDFTETWAVMSVETFERFIEVIVQHDRPLVEVLKDYLVDSADLELSSPMAEDFRNFTIDESKSFAFQQFKIHNIEFLEKTVLGKI